LDEFQGYIDYIYENKAYHTVFEINFYNDVSYNVEEEIENIKDKLRYCNPDGS